MSASIVAVCDGTQGRGAHIPAGVSTHAFSHKPAPVLLWANINERHEWYVVDHVWAVEHKASLYWSVQCSM